MPKIQKQNFELKGLVAFSLMALVFFSSFVGFIALLLIYATLYIHEHGHFLAAKYCKVPVEEISIGIGPTVYANIKENTRISYKAFPIGGYNILSEDFDAITTYRQKILVASGGILANITVFLLSMISFFFLWGIGGNGSFHIIDEINSNLEFLQVNSSFNTIDYEQIFLIVTLLFGGVNLFFALVQSLPLVLFDGGIILQYIVDHFVSSYTNQYWSIKTHFLGRIWAGTSILLIGLWFFFQHIWNI